MMYEGSQRPAAFLRSHNRPRCVLTAQEGEGAMKAPP